MKGKKEMLESALYKWTDAIDEVEDDIVSLMSGHNISKIKIASDVSKMKIKFQRIEQLIKYY